MAQHQTNCNRNKKICKLQQKQTNCSAYQFKKKNAMFCHFSRII